MQLEVISVFDKKTGQYAAPFYVRHVGEAIREWDIVRKDNTTKFGKNPEDFDLFKIGSYDDATGKHENINPALHLASGV